MESAPSLKSLLSGELPRVYIVRKAYLISDIYELCNKSHICLLGRPMGARITGQKLAE